MFEPEGEEPKWLFSYFADAPPVKQGMVHDQTVCVLGALLLLVDLTQFKISLSSRRDRILQQNFPSYY